MLEFKWHFKDIAKPAYFDRWVNLWVPFEVAFDPGRRNLQEAIREAGMQWVSRLHCGLDYVRNTVYLLIELMRRGVTISISSSLTLALAPKEEDETPPPPHPHLQPQAGGHNFSMWHGGCVAGTVPCFCYCGVASMRRVVMVSGPMQGWCFFGCGNCTVVFGPMCLFFSWATCKD
jgi:ERI1 exoribonuclease 2